MAAMVQSYPQQSGTVTMLQTRPSSASGMLPAGQAQGQQYGVSQAHRNSFYGGSGPVGGQAAYRGTSGPIQPYAFTSTPSLHANGQWQNAAGLRSSSTSAVPTMHSFETTNAAARPRYPASVSMSHLPGNFNGGYAVVGSRDDSSLPAVGGRRNPATPRPQSTHFGGMAGTATATQVTFTQATPIKVSPDRYRRPAPRTTDSAGSSSQARPQISAQPSGSGMATIGHLYNGHAQPEQRPSMAHSRAASAINLSRPTSLYSAGNSSSSADDLQLGRQQPQDDLKRLRRRSMPALDFIDFTQPQDFKRPEDSSPAEQHQLTQATKSDRDSLPSRSGSPANVRSGSPANANGQLTVPGVNGRVHVRNGSSDSLASSRSSASRPSSANRNPVISAPTGNPSASASNPDQSAASNGKDHPRLVNIPPRGSSTDAPKNVPVPSPLSRPMTMESVSDATTIKNGGGHVPSPAKAPASPRVPEPLSPAAQQLAAISQKTGKPKSKTSRLRRAFSFGSAAEFRKAAIPEESAVDTPVRLHKEPTSDELYDAEQARIAEQQEAAGIGHSIYAGAKIFAASNDNISISSTASSASIMIRKMGRGMKKGTRSLVGLFRPKSIIGAPTADAQPSEASQAAVSMITVEAERERVNINVDPHTQNGGGTGFPRLERNSIDASQVANTVSDGAGTSDNDNSAARMSIIGGDQERAEVLAAVRKGILKHRGASNSPPQGHATILVPNAPPMTDSPNSSAPSTPNDDIQGHKRSTSVAIGSEDYFMTALRLRQETRSAPVTPQGGTPTGTLRRNATFSPRIIFYDTFASGEYDRRGEISTCNRLTPMLAQQIKEELNSFKMEMEVHETSKIYTHFF